ncbi:MAG: hypothetical protein R3F61_37130 [Myxococcota bacterium]
MPAPPQPASTAHTGATDTDTPPTDTEAPIRATAHTGTNDTDSPGLPTADTGPTCGSIEHDVIGMQAYHQSGDGAGSWLERLEDGSLVVSRHGNELESPDRWFGRTSIIAVGPLDVLEDPDDDGYNGRILGQLGVPVGDVDGDSVEDVVISVFEGIPTYGSLRRSMVFSGPFLPGNPVHVPYGVDEVGWDFDRCDVDADGLADLCSVLGVALAPPPFSAAATFADALPEDRILTDVTVAAHSGALFWRAGLQELQIVPYSSLPPAPGQTSESLATLRQPIPDHVLQLQIADVLPAPGDELVAVVEDQGLLGIVIRALAPGFLELERHLTCEPAPGRGALAIQDFDGDGTLDLAFSASSGRVAVMAGPPSSTSDIVWWRSSGISRPGFPFGFSLLPWDDGDLLVGHPGSEWVVPGASFLAQGEVFRIEDPLATTP